MYKLLIVEPDPGLGALMKKKMEEEYEVTLTSDPKDALAIALQKTPDCILLDLVSAQVAGLELCQTLGSLSHTQLIPIFIITTEGNEKPESAFQGISAAARFSKPLDYDGMKARMADVMASRHPERRTEIRVALRVVVKLEGADARGAKFVLVAITEDVSASGFRCGCTFDLPKGRVVEVYLISNEESHVGQARVVRSEGTGTALPLYGFRFVGKPAKWVID